MSKISFSQQKPGELNTNLIACVRRTDDIARIVRLLDAGADPSARDQLGRFALAEAIGKYEELTKIRTLLKYGANVNARDGDGMTALHHVVRCRSDLCETTVASLKALIEAGADVNARDQRQRTPLHYAAEHPDHSTALAMTRRLVEAGANVNVQDQDGHTPFYFASSEGNHAVGVVLAAHGAKMQLCNPSKIPHFFEDPFVKALASLRKSRGRASRPPTACEGRRHVRPTSQAKPSGAD